MELNLSDGGRSQYFKSSSNDCVVRAICNATNYDYKEIYDSLVQWSKTYAIQKNDRYAKKLRKQKVITVRNGVYPPIAKSFLNGLGFRFTSTMSIGSGCQTHLIKDELPQGTLIVRLSKHLTCVKDGILFDTFDCSRNGTRCVYGYWSRLDVS
tara:strand:+ start:1110 stop:1568 length:459 start_codon:yes stop_codon:yes gene_type:complete